MVALCLGGVPLYVIVHVKIQQVEVCFDPAGRGASAVYRTVKVYGLADHFPTVIDGREIGRVAVKDVVP